VRVERVEGAAAKAGLREGDVLLTLDNTEVTSAKQFEALAGKLDKSRAVTALVRRGYAASLPDHSARALISLLLDRRIFSRDGIRRPAQAQIETTGPVGRTSQISQCMLTFIVGDGLLPSTATICAG